MREPSTSVLDYGKTLLSPVWTLRNNNIGNEGASHLVAVLKTNPFITTLYIYGNNIDNDHQKCIDELLEINHAIPCIHGDSFSIPDDSKSLSSLKCIDLSSSQLDSLFAALDPSVLHTLILNLCQIDIKSLSPFANIRTLRLFNCNI